MALSFGRLEAMSLGVMHNISKATGSVNTSITRLSTGLRINSAKDDPAGLAIATRMSSQIRGLNQAKRNANDGLSLLQTADGSLGAITDVTQRVREISIQAANDTYSESDRQSFQIEIDQLIEEIDRIAQASSFNNTPLLGGNFEDKWLQLGANSGDGIKISLDALSTTTLGDNEKTIASIDITTREGAEKAIKITDTAISQINRQRSYTGAVMNRLGFAIQHQNVMIENKTAARARIMDTDFAAEASALARNSVLQQAGIAMLMQIQEQGQLMLRLLN